MARSHVRMHLCWVLLSAFIFSPLIRAQTDDLDKKKAEAALAEYQKFASNDNANVRRAAAEGLSLANHAIMVKPILAAMAAETDEQVRESLAKALAAQSSKNAIIEQAHILESSSKPEERVAILQAMKKSKPDMGYESILKLTEAKNIDVRYAACDLLGVIKSKEQKSEAALIKCSSDPETSIRIIAMDSLKDLNAVSAAPRAVEMMQKDSDWRARATAMAALRQFRVKEAIQPLIDSMKNEEGRLKDDALVALRDLTGLNYTKLDVWQSWWARAKETYKVPSIQEIKDQKKAEAKAMDAYTKKERGYTPYHGVVTRSKRMLFVLDVSGSMADSVVLASTGSEQRAEFDKRYKGMDKKIDIAREELINTIAGLESYVKFNIVLFHTDVKLWQPNIVSANEGNKADAIKFLTRLTPEYCSKQAQEPGKGKTNTFDALNVCFGITKKPGEKASKEHIVESDTVFFLTDGIPTQGRIQDPAELVKYFKAVNAKAKMVFHCITFGHGNEALLEPMSQSSGGTFLVIGK